MRTSTLFDAKNFGFSKFMVCPHGQGGSIFRDFVRTSFMNGPLPHVGTLVLGLMSSRYKSSVNFISEVKNHQVQIRFAVESPRCGKLLDRVARVLNYCEYLSDKVEILHYLPIRSLVFY